MRKILAKLFIISTFMLFMTGCVRYNADMEIRKDKSMMFTIVGAFDKTQVNDIVFDNDAKREYENKGYLVEEYSSGNYEGVKLTLDVGNIDRLSTENDVQIKLSDISSNCNLFKIKKSFFYNTYTANIKFDIDDSNRNQNNEFEGIDDLDISFSVNLPYKSKNNNAPILEGNKLIWKTENNKLPDLIQFEFYIYNTNKIIAVCIGIILIIILMILLIKGFTKDADNNKNIKINNKNKKINNVPPKKDELRSEFIYSDIEQSNNENIDDETYNNDSINSIFNIINDDNDNTNKVYEQSLEFDIPNPIIIDEDENIIEEQTLTDTPKPIVISEDEAKEIMENTISDNKILSTITDLDINNTISDGQYNEDLGCKNSTNVENNYIPQNDIPNPIIIDESDVKTIIENNIANQQISSPMIENTSDIVPNNQIFNNRLDIYETSKYEDINFNSYMPNIENRNINSNIEENNILVNTIDNPIKIEEPLEKIIIEEPEEKIVILEPYPKQNDYYKNS